MPNSSQFQFVLNHVKIFQNMPYFKSYHVFFVLVVVVHVCDGLEKIVDVGNAGLGFTFCHFLLRLFVATSGAASCGGAFTSRV